MDLHITVFMAAGRIGVNCKRDAAGKRQDELAWEVFRSRRRLFSADDNNMISATQNNLIEANLTPARLGTEISTAVVAKILGAQRQEGAAVLQLIDAAAQAGDPLVAKATGMGGLLDIAA